MPLQFNPRDMALANQFLYGGGGGYDIMAGDPRFGGSYRGVPGFGKPTGRSVIGQPRFQPRSVRPSPTVRGQQIVGELSGLRGLYGQPGFTMVKVQRLINELASLGYTPAQIQQLWPA